MSVDAKKLVFGNLLSFFSIKHRFFFSHIKARKKKCEKEQSEKKRNRTKKKRAFDGLLISASKKTLRVNSSMRVNLCEYFLTRLYLGQAR